MAMSMMTKFYRGVILVGEVVAEAFQMRAEAMRRHPGQFGSE